jgi:hypothetical protein
MKLNKGSLELMLGCDPEVFVKDSSGKHVSAHGLIPGTKDNPLKVKDGMVQVDGMALEFGVDPCATEDEFVTRISSVMTQLASMLPKGYTLDVVPVVVFDETIIRAQPPEALELGCDPDYNAYTRMTNPKPNLTDPCMRSAGGHVHFGWGKNFRPNGAHINACAALAIQLDNFLGVPSLGWDDNALRRALYGAAGAFRPKPYGMEYRSLSNQWLLKESTTRFVYRRAVAAFAQLAMNSEKATLMPKVAAINNRAGYQAQAVINNNMAEIGAAIYEKVRHENSL